MKILLYGDMIAGSAKKLSNRIKTPHELKVLRSSSTLDELSESLCCADILISMTYRSGWPYPKNLKLLQVPGIGVDEIEFSALPKNVAICISREHEEVIGEYVLMGLLTFFHNLKEIENDFKKGSWKYSSRTAGPLHEQLAGKTIGILGYGPIGKNIAKKLDFLGCKIHVANRTIAKIEDNKSITFWELPRLESMVKEVDALIVSIAYTKETYGIINQNILRKMKPGSFLMNIARGQCIDEEALYNSLLNRHLAMAMLDVWWQYPTAKFPNIKPGKYDWSSLDNVIMTPHTSAWSNQMWDKRLNEISENVEAITNNLPLKNLYYKGS